jgi:hypothetical protein
MNSTATNVTSGTWQQIYSGSNLFWVIFVLVSTIILFPLVKSLIDWRD